MPNGKAAGVRCVQLDENARCLIFGMPERPTCCGSLQPSLEMCRDNATEALIWLSDLEFATRPSASKKDTARL
jgi:uncharacterized protein